MEISENQQKLITGFEKLWVWQKAHNLMQEIHKLCKALPKSEEFRLRDQIERCSSSVCDNIAEGYTAYYYNEKMKGFYIARKEAGETQNQIRKLSGKKYLGLEQSQSWVEGYEEIIRGINGYIRYIRKKREDKEKKAIHKNRKST
jgi:four helix bundle protein